MFDFSRIYKAFIIFIFSFGFFVKANEKQNNISLNLSKTKKSLSKKISGFNLQAKKKLILLKKSLKPFLLKKNLWMLAAVPAVAISVPILCILFGHNNYLFGSSSISLDFSDLSSKQQRMMSMILNLILGDAAGITYEYFEGISMDAARLCNSGRSASGLLALAIKGRMHDQHILPKRLKLQGNGYFGAGAGEFSDDTSLALVLMHALVDSDFDESKFSTKYQTELISWYRDKKYTCPSMKSAIGLMTKAKLKNVLGSSEPFKESSNLTNGHIMCAAPLACISDLNKALKLADLKTGYFQSDQKVKDLTKIFVHFLHDLIFNEATRPKDSREMISVFIKLCQNFYSKSSVGSFLVEMCSKINNLKKSSFAELRTLKWEDNVLGFKKKLKSKVYYVEFVRSFQAPLEKGVVYWIVSTYQDAIIAYNNGSQANPFDKMWFRAKPAPYNVGGYGEHEFSFIEQNGITTKYDLGWVLGSSGSGVSCLISALFAVAYSSNPEEAILNAISLFGDTDTVAAIAGQIAGAYYGTVATDIKPVLKYRPNLINEIKTFLNQDKIKN